MTKSDVEDDKEENANVEFSIEEEEREEIIEDEAEEVDVEGVIEKQETHDLICPNCNSCITKRVILRRRERRTPTRPGSDESTELLIPEFDDIIGSFLSGKSLCSQLNQTMQNPYADNINNLRPTSSNNKETAITDVEEKEEEEEEEAEEKRAIYRRTRHPIASRTITSGSKDEEAFFDSQVWLESDREDDFYSVSGDLAGFKTLSTSFNSEPVEIFKPHLIREAKLHPRKEGASYTDRVWEEIISSNLPLNGDLSNATLIELMNKDVTELPESPDYPNLTSLFLQTNSNLTSIPASFFEHMLNLKEVDLSDTGIKSLPQSFFKLVGLQKLFLRNCQVFMELPAQIGQLHNLEVLDLEGTDIIQLPAEIGDLINLTSLKVSFCQWSGVLGETTIVPEGTLSKLAQLVELGIDVDPEDSRWEGAVRVVIKELLHLKKLEYLKMYIPQVELLDEVTTNIPFLLGSSTTGFNLNVGSHMRRVMSITPLGAEGESEHGKKNLRYVNGKGSIPSQVKNVLKYSDALFLDRHFNVTNLSEFGIHNMENLRFCMLGECNELQTIVQGSDDSFKNPVLPKLEQLIIYNMKTLTSLYNTPLKDNSLGGLKTLKLHGCEQLRTIFKLESGNALLHLEEITVEDCPAVLSLITCNNSHDQIVWSFPKLKKISLLYLTELQSIFSGLCTAPNLERLSVYNCPNLKALSAMEIPIVDLLKVIRGEEEWWEALEWNESEWEQDCLEKLASVFVPIRSEADLETQLAQDPIPESVRNERTHERIGSREERINRRQTMAILKVPDDVPSPSQDAETLKGAFEGWGTDEKKVIKVLGYRNASQRRKIKDAYQQLYKESLIDRLRSELSGDFGKAVELWTHDPPERDAKLVHEALRKMRKGSLSKRLEVIVEIACTTSPDHLVAVRKAYCSLFHCSVEEDLCCNVSPPFTKLLVGLVTSYRYDREVVRSDTAQYEAVKLHEAIANNQLDQDQLAWILGTRNVYQLRETFKRYKEHYGRPIYEDLKTCEDGDLVKMVICCLDTPEKHFAKVVRDSTTGLGTDEESLSRVIVTRAEVDMENIRREYFEMCKSSLDDAVSGDTSGYYKGFLMALLGAPLHV